MVLKKTQRHHLPAELLDVDIATLDAEVESYRAKVLAENTKKQYIGQWRRFEAWARHHGIPTEPASPQDIARYLGALRTIGRSVATVHAVRAAIAAAHKVQGHSKYNNPAYHPNIAELLKGIGRTAPHRSKLRP